ncbi:MAG: outer membrane beta-barrel protein [Elusimicrobiota bacterium]
MRKLLAVAAVSCLCASSARASLTDWDWLTQYQKPNVHVDQLALHPYYKFSEVYDSNIFLVPHDLPSGQVGGGITSSWIAKNDLGLEANLPWRAINNLGFGYDFESDVYTTQPAANNTINQSAHADYVREGAQGMTYKAGDQYVNTTDQAFSELVQRERRWMDRVYASADYVPKNGRLAWGVIADHETDKYIDPTIGAGLNRYQEDAGFNVGYMIQPKTKAYVSYTRSILHYTVNPVSGPDKDSKSHTVAAGVIGQLSPKITGQVEVGETYRAYDAAPAGESLVYRSPVVTTNVTYSPDKYTDVILTVSRLYQESIDANNAFYYSNNATLDVKHKFPYKLSAGVNLAVGRDQYVNSQSFLPTTGAPTTGYRTDNLWQGGAWIEYDIQQWLSTGVAYVYRERDSTFSGQFNYADYQASWNVSLKL